ncbi:cell division topological specificity factor MinE [Hespellia stercorisuis]|uniref:Cell division topological specificity factor n=1 Tax=Hespellia stercorisuis DSM 15480 TaxID=1121950 RepID=A0A1M6N391_9FIRM|nr:cell division topological specificity factor MinE [Hespellia stercorisuis]SHJ90174.1 cell division topological specificity factor [Hespellia stercorisuis DSM 15480]
MSVPSVSIAKDRLKVLITADRMQCAPDMIDKLTKDMYLTLSKYVEVKPEIFQIHVTHSDIHIRYSEITGEKN